MTTPTISEAARRVTKARDFLAECVVHSPLFDDWANRFDHAKMLLNDALSALDSAHPAPKEGHAELKEFWLRSIPDGLSPSGRDQVATQIATMQLELSEAKREVEALRAQNKKGTTEYLELRSNYRRTCDAIDSLRTHLKTANELLREAVASLKAFKRADVGDDPEPIIRQAEHVIKSASKHLNQQSK